jgi:23S rRNA (cytosine1962-C5)-methyltransferase
MTDRNLTATTPVINLLSSSGWEEYELLDSGDGQKLERFGEYQLVRPEAEAIWSPMLPKEAWQSAHAAFLSESELHGGHWQRSKALPERWQIAYKGLKFWVQTSASRHVGVFPEQAAQWDWLEAQIKRSHVQPAVLNLFGYTGLASLAALRAGAHVTHLDASRKSVNWAKENQALSGLQDFPIRWIQDDAMKFVSREERRGNRYDGIILDPPKFGRGPKGEVWEFYKLMPALLQACQSILSPNPLFLLLTAYAVKASALTLYNAVAEMMKGRAGQTEAGEVILEEQSAGRLLSMAVYARWWRKE